jgi:hypothetical protein
MRWTSVVLLAAALVASGAAVREHGDLRYVTGEPWPSFKEQWTQLQAQGMRLVSIREASGEHVWSGVFEPGTDASELRTDLDWPSFQTQWQSLSNSGLRLVDIAVIETPEGPRFSGLWRAGIDGHYLLAGVDWNTLAAKWTELSGQGLRLIKCVSYRENGLRKFAGVWRAGNDAYALYGSPREQFEAKWRELAASGLRLIDAQIVVENGQQMAIGVWRAGDEKNDAWLLPDGAVVSSTAHRLEPGALFLGTRVDASGCRRECLGRVVMPTGAYDYGIQETVEHCPNGPGTCGNPGRGEAVVYHWPAIVDQHGRRVRESALHFSDRIFTLPFSDRAVHGAGYWQYGNLQYHHAVDYLRDDSTSFTVEAAAPGRVIFSGWDPWSGNTIIVSHDAGRERDVFRTIYMHLRNGASHDCEMAWSASVPSINGTNLSDYEEHLTSTGCAREPARRRLDPAHWGSDSDRVIARVGQTVAAGTPLAHSGDTGPGGKRGAGGPNTHLHIFFAHRDPTNGQWYFFDPYGIYADPSCYPAAVTGKPDSACAKYPVAWIGGAPRYWR